MIAMSDNDIEIDYGSTIDRTIPNGTEHIDNQGKEYIFNDGYWVSTEAVMNISCTESTKS